MTFWQTLLSDGPIMGMSPMDGVTDAPMRYMTAKYGRPHVIFTEFVSVDALAHAKDEQAVNRLMSAFVRVRDVGTAMHNARVAPSSTDEGTTLNWPVGRWPYEVAQVFGHTPEFFYQAAVIVATLGYDGMDINMGCPAHKVEENGSGAGLIRTPELAQEIVRQAQRGIADWVVGKVSIEDLEVSEAVREWVETHRPKDDAAVTRLHSDTVSRTAIPVSVKTRIGVTHDVVEEWMAQLMEARPAMISLHGRTLKQLYQGEADWEAIGRAAEVVHCLGGHILGNGDVRTLEDGMYKVKQYGVDGFLIGRAAEGNPGVFLGNDNPTWDQRKAWMLEHTAHYERVFGSDHFMPMRKHLAWYCKGFPGASEIRGKLVRSVNFGDVRSIINTI